jgi:hypothetical protein
MRKQAIRSRVPEANGDSQQVARGLSPSEAARLARRTRSIEGWLSPGAVYLFCLIDSLQRAEGLKGNLFEIGVHHGKSALVLGAMTGPGERLGVCDIFGSQSHNVSASGKGDRQIFFENFRDAFPDHGFLTIYEKPSSSLLVDEVTPCRFMHVDGGHSSEEALADLELCFKCLTPGGVIAVDDAFHPTWPGVTDAIFRFLTRYPEMTPLALGFNKLLLVSASGRQRYAEALGRHDIYRRYIPREPYSMKIVEVTGYPTHVFYVNNRRSEDSLAAWLARLGLEHPHLMRAPIALWRAARRAGRALQRGS